MAKTSPALTVDTVVQAGLERIYGLPGDSLNGFTDERKLTSFVKPKSESEAHTIWEWLLTESRRFDRQNACRPRQAGSLSSDQCGGIPRKRAQTSSLKWDRKIPRMHRGRGLITTDVLKH